MIRILVDILSILINLIIFVGICIGGYLGYELLPDSFVIDGTRIALGEVSKTVIGVVGTTLAASIVLGPLLILLDIRDALR